MFLFSSYVMLGLMGFFMVGPVVRQCWKERSLRAVIPFIVTTYLGLCALPLVIAFD